MFPCVTALAIGVLVSVAPAQTPIRIVAANITAGNNQEMTAESTRILKATDPDIVLIQEFNVPGTNSNADIVNYVNSTLGPGFFVFREPGNQNIPNGIISRYPFLETGEFRDTLVPDRDHAWARIDIPGPRDLWAISVHLKASDASTQNAQAQQLLAAMAAKGIPATDYVVVGGDLNTASRTASAINTLASSAYAFATGAPWPVGENGNSNTNRNRNSPYDWVIPNSVLNNIRASTVYAPRVNLAAASRIYANGLVFDTRDFTQALLNEYFPPALTADSNATNMQHQAVIRTFLIPNTGGPTGPVNGTVATVGSFINRAPAQVSINTLMPALSATATVAADEFDVASVSVTRLGTANDTGVPNALIYRDNDNNGAVSPGDSLLGSAAFSAGSAVVGLAPAPRITPSAPLNLLAAVQVAAGATSGSTVGLRLNANGIVPSATGGVDPTPVFSAFSSNLATISGDAPPPPPQAAAAVVVNKYFNDGSTPTGDAIELLVVQDRLDLRGAIVKDYSGSMANDNGGRYVLTNNPLWSNLRAGTVIILRNNTSAADTSATGDDYLLDIGLANSTYATLDSGTFDIAATEMVTIKAAGTGVAGTNGNIHSLAAGAAGAQYTAAPQPKLRANTTVGAGAFCYVTNTGAAGNSRLSNFSDSDGTALTATTGITLGQPNTIENSRFIAFLRGPVLNSAAPGAAEGTIAMAWTALDAANNYRVEISRDPAFSSFVAGYNGQPVGNVTNFTAQGLSPGTYHVRVRASNPENIVGGVRAARTVVLEAPPVAPEIVVRGINDDDIANGDMSPEPGDGTDFLGSTLGIAVARTFTITNPSESATLAISSVVAVGDFLVIQQPATSVAPGGSTTFRVQFNPQSTGLRTGTVTVTSNAAAPDNVYQFAVRGTGVAGPGAFTERIGNNFGVSAAGWSPIGQIGELFGPQFGSRQYDPTNTALAVTVAPNSRGRVIGWVEDQDNDLRYADIGPGNFVRAKFSMFYSGPGDSASATLFNRVPNFRLALRMRGMVQTVLEVNHNPEIAGSPAQAFVTRELGPSKNPAAPSVYRVDLDPVDVPYFTNSTSEGVQRAFEAVMTEPKDYSFVEGTLALTDSSIGTYPALSDAVTPVKTWASGGTAGAADFDNPTVVTGGISLAVADLLRYLGGPSPADYYNPAVLNAGFDTAPATITRSTAGITANTAGLATTRVAAMTANLLGGVFGDTPATRLRVEPGRLYRVSARVSHAGPSDTTPFTRLGVRTAGFGWNQTLELLGARGLPAATGTRPGLAQMLPGAGNQVPGTTSDGTVYNLLLGTPLHPQIRADVAGTIAAKFPNLSAQPGPGDPATGAGSPPDGSLRNVNLAFTVIDSLSPASATATDPAEVANNLRLNRVEIRVYPDVVD